MPSNVRKAQGIFPLWFADWRLPLLALLVAASSCNWDTQTAFRKTARLAGKYTPDLVSVRKTPTNPLAEPLKLFSSQGPQATPRTQQTIRRFGLEKEFESDWNLGLEKLQENLMSQPTPDKVHAFAEVSYIAAKNAEADGQEEVAFDHYTAAVAHAYMYLFEPRFDPIRNPYDPQFRRACDIYNTALEGALRIVDRHGRLRPGYTHTVKTAKRKFNFTIRIRGPWKAEDFGRFEFVSDYQVKGLKNQHHTYGLGVPLIAIRKKRGDQDPADKYYPPNLSFPVTAFVRVIAENPTPPAGAPGLDSLPGNGPAAAENRHGRGRWRPTGPGQVVYDFADQAGHGVRHCVLELCDPMFATDVLVDNRRAPLESDLSTPLAYYLNDPLMRSNILATFALLDGDFGKQFQGLYMLEPYNPRKIPVLMVHGLWSSPVTWTDMFNDLRADPDLRRNYQFWFYLYPTGQPFWVSAAQFRQELDEVRRTLDPQRNSAAFDQMVLVGHSMGGLVSKLQTIASGERFWRILSDRPFEELKADEQTRQKLAGVLFFQPNRSIRRVITLGTPHRGSHFANRITRLAARTLFALPSMITNTTNQVVWNNSGLFKNTEMLSISTSIDSLAPQSPIFPVMLASRPAPWVTYHNVVGRVREDHFLGRLSPESDGIVPLDSAKVENAVTQIEVEADHTKIQSHPRAILEVQQILENHLARLRHEPGYATQAWVDPAPRHMAPHISPAASPILGASYELADRPPKSQQSRAEDQEPER